MNEIERFQAEVRDNIAGLRADADVQALSRIWVREIARYRYAYNFSWMGRPAIQFPQDMIGVQELVWRIRPDLIVETGIAHGGSLVYSASLLQLLGGDGIVVGVDVDIRAHNRVAIEQHPMAGRIRMIQGSSIDPAVVEQVREHARGRASVLVMLDSNHTHEHVLAELEAYAGLVSVDSYCVVFDTFVEDMPDDYVWTDRPWGKGNNPKTAIWEWIKKHPEFEIDRSVEDRILVTSAPDGFLRRVRA
jgi:cephalosporin hydroxylase